MQPPPRPPSPSKRTLVTGVTGFAGCWLAEALLARGETELTGVSREGRWPDAWAHLAGRVSLSRCDLGDGDALLAVLRDARPERVYHLAGYADVAASFRDPGAAWAGNLGATQALFDALASWGGRPRVLFVGSGLIYGDPEAPGQAYDERSLLRPNSPYAASKAAADLTSYQRGRELGVEVVRARPFNHIGPGQSPNFAVAHFAEQVAAIELGLRPPELETGNLNARRDLTDVRDTVEAYALLMEHGRDGEAYNVGTGQTYSMQTVLDHLIALAGTRVSVNQRTELVRPTDTLAIRVDASRLRAETGWAPRVGLEQSLADTLAYWRRQLRGTTT